MHISIESDTTAPQNITELFYRSALPDRLKPNRPIFLQSATIASSTYRSQIHLLSLRSARIRHDSTNSNMRSKQNDMRLIDQDPLNALQYCPLQVLSNFPYLAPSLHGTTVLPTQILKVAHLESCFPSVCRIVS